MNGPDDGEVPPVQRKDPGDAQTLGGGDDRRVNGSERLISVSMDEFGYAQPVACVDRLDVEVARGQISEKTYLCRCAKTGLYQIAHFGYH